MAPDHSNSISKQVGRQQTWSRSTGSGREIPIGEKVAVTVSSLDIQEATTASSLMMVREADAELEIEGIAVEPKETVTSVETQASKSVQSCGCDLVAGKILI